ncbi:probable E3 ubiquitin-protein ligase BAH1-like isoform X1 [Aristolochia californica]|uniref:probable E3 ubiquitin-protein ligase BAH1-like isoform X1 n=1 Tax=Aristolochia californica TaxID=171875 RepID=UPI0035E1A0AA
MKFGETFTEYLHGEQERFLHKCSHVEYKRLKKVLKSCRNCRTIESPSCVKTEVLESNAEEEGKVISPCCQCASCPLCDQKFFSELMKEASEIAGCFRTRVRNLLQLHVSSGLRRYMWYLQHCFKDDQQAMMQKGRILMEYISMNAIAIRKILKKYDKVHSSVNGRNFKTKMRAQHIELLQSPWLIELGAFYLNSNGFDDSKSGEFSCHFSCELNESQSVMVLTLSDSVKLEYSLTCAICLDTVFNPYALGCGHLFCKACLCSSASILLFQGLKSAQPESKCPICRSTGVYGESVHMVELDSLLKNRCKDYWKERLQSERAEMVKQSKEYWESQTKIMIGY